jgi:hypothetical protein
MPSINWSDYNLAFTKPNPLCRGEEQTLTPAEVDTINKGLADMVVARDSFEHLFGLASMRFHTQLTGSPSKLSHARFQGEK